MKMSHFEMLWLTSIYNFAKGIQEKELIRIETRIYCIEYTAS